MAIVSHYESDSVVNVYLITIIYILMIIRDVKLC